MDYSVQPKEIAKRIRTQIKNQSASLREMYYYMNLSHKTVPFIEKGYEVSYLDIYKIAVYLDCSIDYLLGRTDNPKSHKEVNSNE